jgi:hypothetical protein
MAEQYGDWDLKWELLVADAWADPDLKKRLLENPAAVLKERGMGLPKGTQVKVLEDSATVMNLVIPNKPAEDELAEEELEEVAGGSGCRGCRGCGRGCRGCGRGCRGCGRGCRGCRGC